MASGRMDELPPRASDFATSVEALSAARALFDRGDHRHALDLWVQVQKLYPTEPNGYLDAALGLAEIGQAGEADALLAEGQKRFPQAPVFAIERARLARRGGDLGAAAALFAVLRIAAPEEIEGYTEGASCLRELGRFAVAEGVLSDALGRFPEVPALAIQFARLAEEQAEWHQARRRWSAVCESFPDEPQGYLGLSRALIALTLPDEAEAVLTQAVARLPGDVDLLVAHAWAVDHRDSSETLQRLEAAAAQFPHHPSPRFGIGAVLRDLYRLDEADTVLAGALERFPGHADMLINYAHVAEKRGTWAEASRRWEMVVEAHPDLVDGYLGHAAALAEAGRTTDAEVVLVEACHRFPQNADVLTDYARTAHRRNDWQQALDRWVAFQEKFPERMIAYAEMGVALRQLGRFDEADALLNEAAARYPENSDFAINYAWIATYRNDLPEALRRWDDALERFPEDPSPWFGKGAVLCDLGRFDDADAVFADALQRFPDHEDVLVNHARVAQARGDWGEALLRWEAVYARFPDLPEAVTGRATALSALNGGEGGLARAADALSPQSEAIERSEVSQQTPDADAASTSNPVASSANDLGSEVDTFVVVDASPSQDELPSIPQHDSGSPEAFAETPSGSPEMFKASLAANGLHKVSADPVDSDKSSPEAVTIAHPDKPAADPPEMSAANSGLGVEEYQDLAKVIAKARRRSTAGRGSEGALSDSPIRRSLSQPQAETAERNVSRLGVVGRLLKQIFGAR